MKRIVCILFALVILTGCTSTKIEIPQDEVTAAENEEIRAVWISYLDIMDYLQKLNLWLNCEKIHELIRKRDKLPKTSTKEYVLSKNQGNPFDSFRHRMT